MKNIFICTLLAACAFATRINKGDLDSEQPVKPKGPDAEKPFVAEKPKPVDEQPVPEKPKGPDVEKPIAADKPVPIDEKSDPEQPEKTEGEDVSGNEDDEYCYYGYCYGAEDVDDDEEQDDGDDYYYYYYGDYDEDQDDGDDDDTYYCMYGEVCDGDYEEDYEEYEQHEMYTIAYLWRQANKRTWDTDDQCFGDGPESCTQEMIGKFGEDVEYCWYVIQDEGPCVFEEESCYSEVKVGEQIFQGACYDVGQAMREAFPEAKLDEPRPRRTSEQAAAMREQYFGSQTDEGKA